MAATLPATQGERTSDLGVSKRRDQVSEPCRFCGRGDLVWYQQRDGRWAPAHPNDDGSPNPRRIHRYECPKWPRRPQARRYRKMELPAGSAALVEFNRRGTGFARW